jgi:hypothetical protein
VLFFLDNPRTIREEDFFPLTNKTLYAERERISFSCLIRHIFLQLVDF